MTSQTFASPVLEALRDAQLPSLLDSQLLTEPLSGSPQYVSYLPSLERVDLINHRAYERIQASASAEGLYCWCMKRRDGGEEGYLVFRAAEERFNIYRSSDVERMDGLAMQALAAGAGPKRIYITLTSNRAGAVEFSGEGQYEERMTVDEKRGALCVLDSESSIIKVACEFQPAGGKTKQRYLLTIDAEAQALAVSPAPN